MKSFLIILVMLTSTALESAGQTPEEKLQALNIKLPVVPPSIGSYVNAVRVGNLIFLSGKGPSDKDGIFVKGKVGSDVTIEEAYAAARLTAINQLAVLKQELGDLSKVKRVVKVNGFVNSADTFYEQPKVINGFSDLIISVFGEAGKHARTAVGTNTLPLNIVVEVEMIVEVE